jgi:hypothetical protein
VHPLLSEILLRRSGRRDKEIDGVARQTKRQRGPAAFIDRQWAIVGWPDSRTLLPGVDIPN